MERRIELVVNGKSVQVVTDENRPLLEVLREDLGLTGTKYGCGEGECGSCTVLLDGLAVRSCLTSVQRAERRDVRTIEGLAAEGRLHPVQQAFVEKEAMQCGYCVPGQIMAAVAFLRMNPTPTVEEIVEQMSGNLCRCCGYPNLLAAVQRAAELERQSNP